MTFFQELKELIARNVKKDESVKKNKSSTFQTTRDDWNNERAKSDKEFDDASKKAEGLAIFIIVLIAFIIIGMIYVIIKSFILCLSCNFKRDDTRNMEIIILLFGLFCFPIINVIYVFWKPSECQKRGDIQQSKKQSKPQSKQQRARSRSRSRSVSRGRSPGKRRGRSRSKN